MHRRCGATARARLSVNRSFVLLALVACGSRAPIPAPPSIDDKRSLAAEHCPTIAAPYFYRVAKAGPPSYLLGTFHAAVPLAKFPSEVADDIRAARLVVFETRPGDDDGDDGGQPARATPPSSLADAVGPDRWKHYRELAGPETANAVEHRKPEVAVISLLVLYVDTSVALREDITAVAQQAGVAIDGLETDAFQQALIGKQLDTRLLKAVIEQTPDRATLARNFTESLEHYCKGDRTDAGTDAEDRADMKKAGYSDAEIDAIDDEMVYARNRSWIPKLEDMFATGNVFVAVGADHLRGPKGVVELLKARGWAVERFDPTAPPFGGAAGRAQVPAAVKP